MSYIKDLRKYVGHKPILTAGAGLFVFNDKDEVLMQLRTDYNQYGFQEERWNYEKVLKMLQDVN